MAYGARLVLWIVAACYVYGGATHVANIGDASGYDWDLAPVKWQVMDLAFVVLDLSVAVLLPLRHRIGVIAFYAAAFGQIVLYLPLRDWVLDVPPEFAAFAVETAHLDTLLIFHAVTVLAVTAAIVVLRRQEAVLRAD